MTQATKRQKQFNRDTKSLYEMFDYLCTRVDWGKSFLDADGIYCMNELFLKLKKADKAVNNHDKLVEAIQTVISLRGSSVTMSDKLEAYLKQALKDAESEGI